MRYRIVAIIAAGFCTMFAAFGIRYAYGILLPEMLSALAISKTKAGIIYSSYFFICMLCSVISGLLVDRSDARTLLTVFIALLGFGALLMSYASTVLQASIFFGLAGLGHSACWAPSVVVVTRWVSEKRRGIALSIVDLGSATSIAFWSFIIPIIIGPFNWRTVWVFLGLSGFVAATINFFSIRSRPPLETKSQTVGSTARSRPSIKEAYRTIFSDGKFYLIGLSYLLISFSILIPFTFLIVYANQELSIPYQFAASLVAVIGIAGSVGKLFLGYISDFTGRLRIMMLCGILIAAGGLGFTYAQGFLLLVLSTLVFGIGYGSIWPVYAASANDYFSGDYSGSIIGLWTLYHGLGSVLAPIVAGWSIDTTGSYTWAFIMTVISGVLSMMLLLPLAKKNAEPP